MSSIAMVRSVRAYRNPVSRLSLKETRSRPPLGRKRPWIMAARAMAVMAAAACMKKAPSTSTVASRTPPRLGPTTLMELLPSEVNATALARCSRPTMS